MTIQSVLRDLSSKEYLLLVSAAVIGFFAGSVWSVPILAVVLTLCSRVSDPDYFWRFKRVGRLHVLGGFWLAWLGRAAAAIGLCYVLGRGFATLLARIGEGHFSNLRHVFIHVSVIARSGEYYAAAIFSLLHYFHVDDAIQHTP